MSLKPIAMAVLTVSFAVADLDAQDSAIDPLPPSVIVGKTGRYIPRLDGSNNTGLIVLKESSELHKSATDLGLTGRWIVVSSKKDGEFSEAQIGQEMGDLISIGRTEWEANLQHQGASKFKGVFLPVG